MDAKKKILKVLGFPPILLFTSFLVLFLLVSGYVMFVGVESTGPDLEVIEIYGVIREDGGWQPNNITINASEEIVLRVFAVDVPHGFKIPEIELDTGVILAGKHRDLRIRIDEPGTYMFKCIVYCSSEHSEMRGVLIVV